MNMGLKCTLWALRLCSHCQFLGLTTEFIYRCESRNVPFTQQRLDYCLYECAKRVKPVFLTSNHTVTKDDDVHKTECLITFWQDQSNRAASSSIKSSLTDSSNICVKSGASESHTEHKIDRSDSGGGLIWNLKHSSFLRHGELTKPHMKTRNTLLTSVWAALSRALKQLFQSCSVHTTSVCVSRMRLWFLKI